MWKSGLGPEQTTLTFDVNLDKGTVYQHPLHLLFKPEVFVL